MFYQTDIVQVLYVHKFVCQGPTARILSEVNSLHLSPSKNPYIICDWGSIFGEQFLLNILS